MLSLLVLTQLVSAISIEIESKGSFGLGEEISFTCTILSEVTQDIEYVAVVNCPSAPLSLLEIKNTTLEANIPFMESYVYMSSVGENIGPQNCNISIGVLNPETIERKSFKIIAYPNFEFNALSCKNSSCDEVIKVFILNEDIYLDYISEVSEVFTTTVLIYPDGTIEKLSLPASIKAKQTGTYSLNIIASSLGYKTITKSTQFGVVEEEVNIPYINVRDVMDEKEPGESRIFLVFGGIILTLILVAIVFIIVRKKKKNLLIKKR